MSEQKDYMVNIILSPAQASIVMRACELFSRLRAGQLDHVIDEVEDMQFAALPKEEKIRQEQFDKIIENRESVKEHLIAVKSMMFPELRGYYSSYGVGHDERADIAWEVYTTIRHKVSWHEHPEGGYTVNFNTPMQFSQEALPKCEILKKNPSAPDAPILSVEKVKECKRRAKELKEGTIGRL